jgi:multicomponent Na+:H+ antiporter subunit G
MNLLADIAIWLLLVAGIGFGALSLFGLVIFPDIRSRMYTAIRAMIISITSFIVAALVYAAVRFLDTGASQYVTLALETIFLWAIILLAATLLSRQIQGQMKGL